jgi:hypothetical protein
LSEAQAAVMHHLESVGHSYLCSSDYRDVIETLKGWGKSETLYPRILPLPWLGSWV